jgi:hypothetical protein
VIVVGRAERWLVVNVGLGLRALLEVGIGLDTIEQLEDEIDDLGKRLASGSRFLGRVEVRNGWI